MNEISGMILVFFIVFMCLLFILYTGESTIKGRTLREWIHGSEQRKRRS